jgi:hypothetical protein
MLDPTGGMLAFLAEAGVMFVAKVGWNIERLVRVVRQGRLVHRRLVHRAVSMCCSPRAVGNRVSVQWGGSSPRWLVSVGGRVTRTLW